MRQTPDKMRAWLTLLRKKMNLKSLVVTLAAIVVFTTTYLLILPAFTLDKEEAVQQGGIDVVAEETAAMETESENVETSDSKDSKESEAVTTDAKEKEEKTETVAPEQKTEAAEKAESKKSNDKPDVKLLTKKTTINAEKADGDDFAVTAVIGKDAQVPADVTITATELDKKTDGFDYDQYKKDALAALKKDSSDIKGIKSIKFYDISLESDSQDESVEPSAPVSVKIAYEDGMKVSDADNIRIVHFAEQKNGNVKAEVLDEEKNKIETKTIDNGSKMTEASFVTDGFSVYAIVEGGEQVTYRHTYHFMTENGSGSSKTLVPYDFVNTAGNYVNVQIVKNGDKVDKITNPSSDVDLQFDGWYIANVTTDDDGNITSYSVTNNEFNSFDETLSGINSDEDIYLVAKFSKSYIVTFYDNEYDVENPNNIYTKSLTRTVDAEGNTTYIIYIDGLEPPAISSSTVFAGWTDANGNEVPQYADESGTYLSFTQDQVENNDYKLYPIFAEGHWLRFVSGESGSGAVHKPAIFVKATDTASAVSSVPTTTRTGYSFDGWYDGSMNPETGAITYGSQIANSNGNVTNAEALLARLKTGDVTLYGKWTGNETEYKVAIFYENADDDGFSYIETKTRMTGRAGELTNYVPEEVAGFHVYGSTTDPKYAGETNSSYTLTQKVIAGDGSTVLNVYYARNLVTLSFVNDPNSLVWTQNNNGSFYKVTRSGGSGGYTYYYKSGPGNSDYAEMDFNAYYAYKSQGPLSYSGNNNENRIQLYYVQQTWGGGTRLVEASATGSINRYDVTIPDNVTKITKKYGQIITGSEWPNNPDGTTAWYLSPNGSVFVNGMTTMPINDTIYYYQQQGSTYTLQTRFNIQTLNGGDNYSTYKIASFKYDSNNQVYTTSDDYTAIKGFRLNAASAEDASLIRETNGGDPDAVYDTQYRNHSAAIGTTYNYGEPSDWVGGYGGHYSKYTLNFYYLRNQYNIYFNDNGSVVEHIDDIYYEADISDVASEQIARVQSEYTLGKTKSVPGLGEYEFVGWYDNEACLGEPINLDTYFDDKTMPANHINLYAKWSPVWYLVQVDPNGGEIAPGNEDMSTFFWLQYGTKISRYVIDRPYVEDPNGEYIYVYVPYNDATEGFKSSYRKAWYVKESEAIANNYTTTLHWTELDESGNPVARTAEFNYRDYVQDGKYKPAVHGVDEYVLSGWIDVTPGSENYGKQYAFGESITGEVSIQAVWKHTGAYTLRYNGIAEMVDPETGETVNVGPAGQTFPDDTGYADKSSALVLYQPEAKNITKGWVFDGWRIRYADGTHSDQVYEQGDKFELDAATMATNNIIYLDAVYHKLNEDDEPVPVTTIKFNSNYPADGAANTIVQPDEFKEVPVNTAVDLKDYKDLFTYNGYRITGWSTEPDPTAEGAKVFGIEDVVGIDNLPNKEGEDPMVAGEGNNLYAIWERSEFKVYIYKQVWDGNPTHEPFTVENKINNEKGDDLTLSWNEETDEYNRTELTVHLGDEVVIKEKTPEGNAVYSIQSQLNNEAVAKSNEVSFNVTEDLLITDASGGVPYIKVTFINTRVPEVKVLKVDKDDHSVTLKGAEFTIASADRTVSGTVSSGEDGFLSGTIKVSGENKSFDELPAGSYTLTETKAPDGYVVKDNTTTSFEVSYNGVTNSTPVYVKDADGQDTSEIDYYLVTVENEPGVALPHTGGIGTTIFYIFGSILVIGCGIVLVSRKRMGSNK